jgi:hypothetical protein
MGHSLQLGNKTVAMLLQKISFEWDNIYNNTQRLVNPIVTKTDIMTEIQNFDIKKACGHFFS